MKLFVNGVWTRPDRTIKVNGVEHDLDEYAKEHGIELPEGKKHINTDVEEKHEDMEQSHDSGDTEVDGDGDSESTE
jgi:cytochrome b involved in lipid metabolism